MTIQRMTLEKAKQKCKNFLIFLIELSKPNPTIARNVKNLIQGLIDGEVSPEDFPGRLVKEVNSNPQPSLPGFLKKVLPALRLSLANKEFTIEGIRPPVLNVISTGPTTLPDPQTTVCVYAHMPQGGPRENPTAPVTLALEAKKKKYEEALENELHEENVLVANKDQWYEERLAQMANDLEAEKNRSKTLELELDKSKETIVKYEKVIESYNEKTGLIDSFNNDLKYYKQKYETFVEKFKKIDGGDWEVLRDEVKAERFVTLDS